MTVSNAAGWIVHKFGGSSVADADCFRRVAAILAERPAGRLAVVLSACKGVTDTLLDVVHAAAEGRDTATALDALRRQHAEIAQELLPAAGANGFLLAFDQDLDALRAALATARAARRAEQATLDVVAGYGELWSTRLFSEFFAAQALRPGAVRWFDARDGDTPIRARALRSHTW
jgi:aspartokinase/homoserine dehydrogenase 1